MATASHAQTQLSRLYSIIFSILENNNMTEKNFESSRLRKKCFELHFCPRTSKNQFTTPKAAKQQSFVQSSKKDIKYTDLTLYLQVESN